MTPTGPSHYQAALRAACTAAALDSRDAAVLHIRANAVYYLPHENVAARIRYAPTGRGAILERATAAVEVTRWLRQENFPATEPLDIDQPIVLPEHVATFWQYVTATSDDWRDTATLGRVIRALHQLPPCPATIPAAKPLGSLRADLESSTAVPAEAREWLLTRAGELEGRYQHSSSELGTGLVHGDAHTGNLLPAPHGVLLGDWDSVSYGPRELDLIPTSLGYRFGRPQSEWQAFCAAYGIDPSKLPSLDLLQQLRELRALAAYVRNADIPSFRKELVKRITGLRNRDQATRWQAL